MPGLDELFELPELTGYARIRRAALELFAEQGVAPTSMRAIAARAGVSLGLVQHHFRTKDGLRDHVNRYAVVVAQEAFGWIAATDDPESRRLLADRFRAFAADRSTVLRYVARGVADRDPGTLAVFDAYVEIASSHVAPRAAVHLVMRALADALLRPALEHRQT